MEEKIVCLPLDEFEELQISAVRKGVRQVLKEVGLDGDDAAEDIKELRNLLEAWKDARKIFWQTTVKMATTGLLVAICGCVLWKIKGGD